MRTYLFRVELEEEDGVWSAVIPVMPGCAVDADSPEEALVALREVAEIFVDLILGEGENVPLDDFHSNVVDGPVIAVVASLPATV